MWSWADKLQRPGSTRWLALLGGLILLSGCAADPAGELPPPPAVVPTHLWLGIEDGAGPLGEMIAAAFPAGDEIVVHMVSGGRQPLLDDLAAAELDAVFIHQLPPEADTALWYNPVAVDGLALIVHPDNPVDGVTRREAQAIFSGEIERWSALGGGDLPIEPLVQAKRDSGRILFDERVLTGRPIALAAVTLTSVAETLAAVAANPAAVGYVMMGELTAAVKPLALEGRLPDRNTTGTQQYALTAPIYFVSLEEPHGRLRALLAWLQSPEGQSAVGQTYGRVR